MRKKTQEEIIEFFNSVDGYKYISGEYKNQLTKLEILHEECGRTFLVNYKEFKKGTRCSKCFGTYMKNPEIINQEFRANGIYDYEMVEYYGALEKNLIRHNKCGRLFNGRHIDIIRGHGCTHCYQSRKHSLELIHHKLSEEEPEYEMVSDIYTNNHDKNIIMKHITCGNEFTTSYGRFFNTGRRCPHCASIKSTSKEEQSLKDFVRNNYSGTMISNWRSNIIDNLEIDIYLPELKVGIEYNGIYWHSSKHVEDNFHIKKTDLCKSNGIRLIHIFSDEWMDSRTITENKILNILGFDKKPIYARKCNVVDISSSDKNKLLESAHIQGKDTSSFYKALEHNGELVAVMTFSKPRTCFSMAKEDDITYGAYELVRFATTKRVVGGFAKLIKHCTDEFGITKIKTYADLRYTSLDSNVYKTNGFDLLRVSKPGYYYIRGSKRLHRFGFMKSKLKTLLPDYYSDSKSEREITTEAGIHRIYDCGQAVYFLNLNKGEK